jgi:hypothetical protein
MERSGNAPYKDIYNIDHIGFREIVKGDLTVHSNTCYLQNADPLSPCPLPLGERGRVRGKGGNP